MKYKENVEAGIKYGPGGYGCACCRPRYTKADIHRKLRRKNKVGLRTES